MNTKTKNTGKTARIIAFLGIGLCGLCCALPIIGIVGGAGVLSTIAVYAEKIGIVLLIIAVAAFAVAYYQRRKSPTCNID